MNIVICSAFRNASAYIDRYFEQIDGLGNLLAHRRQWLSLIIGYGDSTDDTHEMLFEASSWSVGARLVDCSHGGPAYGSIVDADRFRQLAHVANQMWRCIPQDADVAMLLDGDLIWQPETLARLIDHVEEMPAVAPRVMHATNPGLYGGPGPFWYDTFSFRRNGVRFDNTPPYHRDLSGAVPGDLVQLDSAGGCLAVRGDLARQVCFPEEDVVVGMCRQIRAHGGSIWLDPGLEVKHP